MLGQATAEELLKRALRFSTAAETEVLLMSNDAYLTRFANNIIHQNVGETDVTLIFRAVDGKRAGIAGTNDLSGTALQQAAERALQHARQQPEDPHFPGLPDPQPSTPAHTFDEATAQLSPTARAEDVGGVCAEAAAKKLNAYGAFSSSVEEIAVANSRGVMTYHVKTHADFQTTVMGGDGSGRARASSWKAGEIDAEAIGREALDKAIRAQHPHEIEPGDYTVVVDPYVTQDLLMMLNLSGMSALAVQEGRSWMNDRIGQALMSPRVSIWDDGHDLTGIPLPFDFEGVPRQRVSIVEQGVLQGPVYDRYTAGKDERASTGHALPSNMAFVSGPLAFNLFMASGDQSVDEMIRSTERGLYITRFWYTRIVHPRDCVVTGMTRDGLFLIENGELVYPVKNLRFTQSYVKALADVQAVGRTRHTLANDMGIGATCVPALKIASFNFTGRTI